MHTIEFTGKGMKKRVDILTRVEGEGKIIINEKDGKQAVESAFGINVDRNIENLRKLYYYGEWIQSHSIHVFFLHLPDFNGKSSMFEIAKERTELLKDALKIKSVGGKIVEIIGGRVVHPVSVKAGGFTKYPEKEELKSLIPLIEESIELAKRYTEEFSKLDFPNDDIGDVQFVSLYRDDEYAILNGSMQNKR